MLLNICYAFDMLLFEEGDPLWPNLAPPCIRPLADLAEKQQHL